MNPTRGHVHHRKEDDAHPEKEPGHQGLLRWLFDYTGIAAVIGGALAWGVLSNRTDNNAEEIRMLRAQNAVRAQSDLVIAREMATKADVQRLSDQLSALSDRIASTRGTQR